MKTLVCFGLFVLFFCFFLFCKRQTRRCLVFVPELFWRDFPRKIGGVAIDDCCCCGGAHTR